MKQIQAESQGGPDRSTVTPSPPLQQDKERTIVRNGLGDFCSRRRHRQTRLGSWHSHIQITTKIQNHHHPEPADFKLNGSPTMTELKKPRPFSG